MQLPSPSPVQVLDELDLAQLVAYLRAESRERPVVILTTGPGEYAPYVPVESVAQAAGGRADIVVIGEDRLTHALTGKLETREASVFRGACRVYPPGTNWETNPWPVPLFMARDAEEIKALPGRLLTELRRVLDQCEQRPEMPPAPARAPRSAPPAVQRVKPAPPPAACTIDNLPGQIETAQEAEALSAHLFSPRRDVPVVVVSRSTGLAYAYADTERLRRDLSGLAEVFEITTLAASWSFAQSMPDMCQVYGGASRVYPLGTDWEHDPYLSPLRFAYGKADRDHVTRDLVSDAMTAVGASGSLELGPSAPDSSVRVSGEVAGVVAGSALVNIRGGGTGVVWPDLVQPGEPAERIFVKGMTLEGHLDPDSRRIQVLTPRLDAKQVLVGYQPGATVWARVASVNGGDCVVELFPGTGVTIAAQDVTATEADLTTLLSLGEVLPALVVARHDAEWLLSIREAADDAITAPSILPGGPPWLVAADPTPPPAGGIAPAALDDEPDDEADNSDPNGVPSADQALRVENRQLVNQVRHLEARATRLQENRDQLRKELRQALNRRDRAGAPGVDDSNLFADPGDQMNFDINLAWARMTPAAEKKDLPLQSWTYSPHFFDTIAAVDGISRDKIVEVIIHVLTRRDKTLASRELHQLRTGRGGEDPPRSRNAGRDTCWRVNLQTNTPSARRLHYWLCADGSIELSSIRLHDNFEP